LVRKRPRCGQALTNGDSARPCDDPWYKALGDEETLIFRDPKMQRRCEAMDLKERAIWLIGQLWNSTDTLGSKTCDQLELPWRSTYSREVRALRALV